ncbi:MAG: hypothetical protein ABI865_11940 [Nitrosospira sp.]
MFNIRGNTHRLIVAVVIPGIR